MVSSLLETNGAAGDGTSSKLISAELGTWRFSFTRRLHLILDDGAAMEQPIQGEDRFFDQLIGSLTSAGGKF